MNTSTCDSQAHNPEPATQCPGLPASQNTPADRLWQCAMQGVLAEVYARTSDYVPPSRQWFKQLPTINRYLLGSGTLCICLGLLCLVGVPLIAYTNEAAKSAIFPYTAEGKRQTCFSNLKHLHDALMQYSSDHDGKLPVVEYSVAAYGKSKERKTWVALLQPYNLQPYRGESGSFTCPTQSSNEGNGVTVSGYGINPVLLGRTMLHVEEGEESNSMLLADRAYAHDTILLPPFAGWPIATVKHKNGHELSSNPYNLEYRHHTDGVNQTAILYTDGHARSRADGSWAKEMESWGGEVVLAASLGRLQRRYPLLKQIAGMKTVSPSSAHAFASQKSKLRHALGQLALLDSQGVANGITDQSIQSLLWKGAGTLKVLKDTAFEKQLYADLHVRSQRLLNGLNGDGHLPEWQKHESELGFAVHYPPGWHYEYQEDGRYRTSYFRSASPYIEALVEKGERSVPTNATTIDWSGIERGLREKYGKSYRRIGMNWSTLGGETVSLWECEIKKPDGPKLRKLYLGHSSMWDSTILVFVAPAPEWGKWRSIFAQFQDSFRFRE